MRIKLLFAFMLLAIAAFGQQGPIQIDANGLTQTFGAGGIVTRGQIVKINSSGQVVPVLTTDTSGAIGIAATSQQNVGQVVAVSIAGSPLVQIDASGCTAGNIVSISTTTGGAGHCASSASGQQIGVALSISSPGSNFWNMTLSLGSGGGLAASSPIPANQAQGPRFNVQNYGAKGDARVTVDCATTANSAIITSATANWQSADVGKIFLTTSNSSLASNLTGVNATTIVSRQSATQVTLAVTAINTLSGQYCVWATQDDTSAFLAAVAAASTATSQRSITGAGPRIDSYPGAVFVPSGGYVLSNQIINCQPTGSGGLCPSFIGEGIERSVLYLSPAIVTPLLEWVGANGVDVGNFSYTSMRGQITAPCGGFACGLIWISGGQKQHIHDISEANTPFSSGGGGQIFFVNLSGAHNLVENISMANTGGPSPLLRIDTVAEFGARNLFLSNGSAMNFIVANSPTRNATDTPVFLENVISDECGAAPCAQIIGSGVNWVGGGVFGEGGASGAMSVDATSIAFLTDMNIGSFATLNNNVGLAIAAGGQVYATMDTIRGNGTSAAVSGTSTSVFNDVGGNQIQNCSSTTCANVTAAQYATLGFTGGIVPKATVTHTPNTCYAVTGNLLATAQNICTIAMDQNYQVVNLTAQSGGTTPANSSCATPPVITMSDGTRTATLTMTTGKTTWSSAVDAQTNVPGQVFASGATLTVSIGANTCATPPSNVSVNYVLQSVLNP